MTAVNWSPSAAVADGSERVRVPAERLHDVDRAKGFAILLVVLGHLTAREPLAGNDWYLVLQAVIYSFHMPFFMYLAGVVCAHGGNRTPRPDYWSYLRRRAERLLVPFVLFGVVILLGKMLAQNLVHVDNVPESFPSGLISLVWDTSHSPATSVWFIFVLFVYCLITPALLRLSGGRLWPLLALAALLHIVSITLIVPDPFYLNRIMRQYLFFVSGLAIGGSLPVAMPAIDRLFPLTLGLFIAALTVVALGIGGDPAFTVSSLLSIPALHGLMRRASLGGSRTLLRLGGYSFVIYLLNTIFIGLTKGVLLKFVPWDGPNFLIFVPALMAAGLLGPILVKHLVLRRAPVLDRLTN